MAFEELEAQFPDLMCDLPCWGDLEDEEMAAVDNSPGAPDQHAQESPFADPERQFPDLVCSLSYWGDLEDQEMGVIDCTNNTPSTHVPNNSFSYLETFFPELADPLTCWAEHAEEEEYQREQLRLDIEAWRIPVLSYPPRYAAVTEEQRQTAAIHLEESRQLLCSSGVQINVDALDATNQDAFYPINAHALGPINGNSSDVVNALDLANAVDPSDAVHSVHAILLLLSMLPIWLRADDVDLPNAFDPDDAVDPADGHAFDTISPSVHPVWEAREFAAVSDQMIHHFNWLGQAISVNTTTAPEESLAIIQTSPKDPTGSLKYYIRCILNSATPFIDPVIVDMGCLDVNLLDLTGSALIEALRGRVHKLYSPHGTWMNDEENNRCAMPDFCDDWINEPSVVAFANGIVENGPIQTWGDWEDWHNYMDDLNSRRRREPKKLFWKPSKSSLSITHTVEIENPLLDIKATFESPITSDDGLSPIEGDAKSVESFSTIQDDEPLPIPGTTLNAQHAGEEVIPLAESQSSTILDFIKVHARGPDRIMDIGNLGHELDDLAKVIGTRKVKTAGVSIRQMIPRNAFERPLNQAAKSQLQSCSSVPSMLVPASFFPSPLGILCSKFN